MTRIIQRCLLVLAFTGILLSRAQEVTVSDVSDPTPKSSKQTSSSAPESSFTSVGPISSHSPIDKAKDGSSSYPEAAANSSNPEVTSSGVTEKYRQTSDVSASKENIYNATAVSTDYNGSDRPQSDTQETNDKNNDSSVESTTGLSLAHSGGLFKAHLQYAESNTAEVQPEKSISLEKAMNETSKDLAVNETNTSGNDASGIKNETANEVMDSTSETSVVTKAAEAGRTTGDTALDFTEVNTPENNSNDSGQSSVPSKEELIYNSSHVDSHQTPEKMFSTAPSKVQTEESEPEDSAKSATRKRSLNATNTMTSSTTVASLGLEGSSTPDASSHAMLPREALEVKSEEIVSSNAEATSKQTTDKPLSGDKSIAATNETEKIVNTTHGTIVTEVTSSPYTISSATGAFVDSSLHSIDGESEHFMMELESLNPEHNGHVLSSAALSSLNEESIHPSESIDTTAQIASIRPDTSTPQRYPELEVDYAVPIRYSDFPVHSESPVTFDPNGMTHNFSQDPDSITFTPEIFHVDGIPTDGYLTRLEKGDSQDHRPANFPDLVKFTEGTTHSLEMLGSKVDDLGMHSSERELEVISPSGQDLLPHDEPDIEEMSNRNVVPNTNQPTINMNGSHAIQTVGTQTDITKVTYPLNDESEEMLNDSPHFVQIQSKSTMAPIIEMKNEFISKDVEANVSNDISHTTGSSSQNTPEAVHELDFSIDYQTEQSQIRPVTVASPSKTLESITLLHDSFNVESQSPPEVTKSGQSDTVLPDTSSPIILPNPAPSVVNQSAEATTVVLQPDTALERNVSELTNERENNATINSTIAGVAVKTSVSVSFPLSKPSNSSMSSTVDEVRDDTNVSSNISEVILPVPIHLSKGADGHPPPSIVPTETPAVSTTTSGGFWLLKPKLKSGNSDAPETPRTRKPILSILQRPSTTVGPPVSIFKKSRTRGASITSSTTARPFPQFSTFRENYGVIPGMLPAEVPFSIEPVSTTVPTTTETEEPFSDEPFTEQTQGPIVPSEDDVTLMKVAGYITVDKGLRWNEQLNNRHSPQYKEKANFVLIQLNRLFKTSPIASQVWKIEIDGFSVIRNTRSVAIDFFLNLIQSPNGIQRNYPNITSIFHDKLKNNTFSRFTVDPTKTSFEFISEEPMKPTPEAPELEQEPVIPQWAIAVIVVGAASLIFIVLFAVVAILGRHHMRRRYSNKLNDEDSDRPSDWESKMAAAYENLAADTIYDAEDLHSDTYKKKYNSTFHGRPSRPCRADSWSSSDWSPPPRRPRPQVHKIVY